MENQSELGERAFVPKHRLYREDEKSFASYLWPEKAICPWRSWPPSAAKLSLYVESEANQYKQALFGCRVMPLGLCVCQRSDCQMLLSFFAGFLGSRKGNIGGRRKEGKDDTAQRALR